MQTMPNISGIPSWQYIFQSYEECMKRYSAHLPTNACQLSEDGKIMSNISEAIDGPLVVPDGVEVVDFGREYSNDELTAFILPDSVKEIRGNFYGYNCRKLEFARLSPNMALSEGAFCHCPLRLIIIPEGIKIIPENAFKDNRLIELRLPESLEYIMHNAFNSLNEIEEITIPQNVKIIMPGAFGNCRRLRKINLLSTDTIIFPKAFENCSQLENVENLYENHKIGNKEIGTEEVVYFEEKNTRNRETISSAVLKYVPKYFCGELILKEGTKNIDNENAKLSEIEGITKLYIPDSMVENIPLLPPHVKTVRFPENMEGISEDGRALNIDSDSLESFNFPKGLLNFKIKNARITALEIPDSVKSVDICNMPNLKRLVLPSTLERLDLSNLPLLEDLTIPYGIKKLGREFGERCGYLKNVILPDTLEIIGEYAFYGCEKLTKIIIPSSVKKIEIGAFSQCHNLTEVIMEGKPKIHPQAFDETPGYDVKVSGLATFDYDEDEIPVVDIDLVSVYAGSYGLAMSFDEDENFISEQWGEAGIFMISKSHDMIRFPFDNIMYIDGSLERTYDLLNEFCDINENYCEEALSNAYVFYQEPDHYFSEEAWENTARALSIIFKPKHCGLRYEESIEDKEYEGPEAIFKFKIYDKEELKINGWDKTEPFYEARYRVFKNDEDEWTSEKLDS